MATAPLAPDVHAGAGVSRDNAAMKDSLAVGLEHSVAYEVTPDMAPPHLPVQVLSTPAMILLVERTCLAAAQEHLDATETTVGTHVCVSHTGAVAVGESVTVHCMLKERDRRRLTFDVDVTGPAGSISSGTHDRFVVDAARFASG
jgi:predicted thioesterase